MSAAEIIEAIKKLPPEEWAEVQQFMQSDAPMKTAEPHASDSEFERAAKEVLADNQDLLRRLSQ